MRIGVAARPEAGEATAGGSGRAGAWLAEMGRGRAFGGLADGCFNRPGLAVTMTGRFASLAAACP